MAESGDAVVGKVHGLREEIGIEWTIPQFWTLSDTVDGKYNSSSFVFSDIVWHLSIFPNGARSNKSEEHIGIYLCPREISIQQTIDWTWSLRNANGQEEKKEEFTYEFDESCSGYGSINLCSRSELQTRKSELLPDGALTIVCSLKKNKRRPLHEAPLLERLLNVSRCMQKLLDDEENTDIILKTSDGRDIPAHRLVLEARSEVFQKMLSHDMLEKKTGEIVIEDVEEDVLKEVLGYLYSGCAEVTSNNACPLYVAADKYDLKELKAMCVAFIEENISNDLFCDVYMVADKCNANKLMRVAEQYLQEHSKDIMKTENWKKLEAENPALPLQILKTLVNLKL